MKPVPIHEAKTNLSRLVARACAGEEIIIAKGGRPVCINVHLQKTDFREGSISI